MKLSSGGKLYLALIHHPVISKKGEIITSSVTGLDLHDISRAAKTYNVKQFFVVTPLKDQQELVQRLLNHWLTGAGADLNPIRKQALELIRVTDSLEDALSAIQHRENQRPMTVATCASYQGQGLMFNQFREMLNQEVPYLMTFGTAWGLSREFIANADYVLCPISGNTGYNHLSVRSAVSIILDRLIGIY